MKIILRIIFAALFCAPVSRAAPDKPNFIVIMADDLGYGDVSANGTSAVDTPHMDRLAAEGLRFTSGYCSASTCTPTRYSFLTGTYAFRTPGTGIAPPNGPAVIRPGTETIASLLKKAGYATAVVGKWHLGLGDKKPDWNGELRPGPLDIGFDHCLLLPTTNDRVPQVFVEDRRVRNLDPADPLWVGDERPSPDHPTGVSHRKTLKMDWSHGHNGTIHNGISRIGFYTGGMAARFRDQDLADEWARASAKWIEAHKDQPFFLFLASHDIHVPRTPHERFVGKSGMGPRGDAIVEFDWQVGELVRVVDQLGLAEKTLIVVCSDNGPVLDDGYKDQAVQKLGSHKPSGVFRGGKYSVFEGGTRTPFFTRWKGRILPGVSDEIVCTVDLAATLARMAGVDIPANACLDSMDVGGALLGEKGARGRDELLQQDNNGARLGYRRGHWKLVQTQRKDELFNLANDPGETTDLAGSKPEILEEMRQRLEAIRKDGRSRSVPR